MSDDEEVSRKLRKLNLDHAEIRWRALRIEDDVKQLCEKVRVVRAAQAECAVLLTEDTTRSDSMENQLRLLTQIADEVLDRLPRVSTPLTTG